MGGFLSRRHKVEVHFGPPIWPAADEDRAEVMRRVRDCLDMGGAVSAQSAREPVTPAV
jgi:hypothetical protein